MSGPNNVALHITPLLLLGLGVCEVDTVVLLFCCSIPVVPPVPAAEGVVIVGAVSPIIANVAKVG